MYSALCWHSLRAPQPGGRRKASSLGSRPLPLHPSAENPHSLRGYPKQPSVRWKSKGQNPEFWPAGPALLLALCRPAGPGPPARMPEHPVSCIEPFFFCFKVVSHIITIDVSNYVCTMNVNTLLRLIDERKLKDG